MRKIDHWRWGNPVKKFVRAPNDFEQIARTLCESALEDAKTQLHPLLRNIELDRLDQRGEFIGLFKSALEQRIARKLAIWQPEVQAVFRYDEIHTRQMEPSDGFIHLLVKVHRLSNALRLLGRTLDGSLVNYLRQMLWRRFETCQSILDVHQVTLNELRHGVSYGAMFYSVYTAPVKVWPQVRQPR